MTRRLQYLLSVVIALGIVSLIAVDKVLGASVIVGLAVIIPLALKLDTWFRSWEEKRRLMFDADYQHAAWLNGDDRTAFFGRWQP